MNPTDKQNLRGVIVGLFPWLTGVVAIAGAAGKGLVIRAASGILHLAGGPGDPAVFRTGDMGSAGRLEVTAPGVVTYYDPNNVARWTMALTSASPASPVGTVIAPLPGGSAGAMTIKAGDGSQKVTCA